MQTEQSETPSWFDILSPICVDDEIRSCTSEIIRLQETLSARDSVISQQIEENKSLLNKINEMEEVLKHTNPPHIVKTDNKLNPPLGKDESGAAPIVCTVKIVHRYIHAVVPCVDRVEIDDGKSTRVVVRRSEKDSFQSCFVEFINLFAELYGQKSAVVLTDTALLLECFWKLFNSTAKMSEILPNTVFTSDDRNLVEAKLFLCGVFGLSF